MTLCGDFYGLFADGTPPSPMLILLERQHRIMDMEHMKMIARSHLRRANQEGRHFAAILFVENDCAMFVFKREEL